MSDTLIFLNKDLECINGSKNRRVEMRMRRVIIGKEMSRGQMRFAVPPRVLIYSRPSTRSESSYLQASLVIRHR